MTNKEIWVKIINDARWYDGSPHTLEKMIRHFEAQGYVVSQLLQQTQCTTLLEFEKQMPSSTTLSDRLKEYLKTVKPEDLVREFEKLGYEFMPIDEPPIA